MDPVSHAVLGRVITTAVARDGATFRGAAAASILGALSPDVDFLLMPFGWDIYLRAHAVGTHSLIGAAITGLGSAALVRVCVRGSTLSRLAGVALIGAASHIAADVVSGARLHPGWPLFETISAVPLVAMADPWPIVILATGAVMFWLHRRTPRVARQVLLVLVAFLVVKAALLRAAMSTFESAAAGSSQQIVVAQWGSLRDWYVFDRAPAALRQWSVEAGRRPPTLLLSWPLLPESPRVTRSRSLDTVRNFLDVHELGFARERPLGTEGHEVVWSDIRYCWRPEPGAEPIACALWFGGIFGPDDRVLTQQVRVGSWVRNRPPPSRE